MSSNKYQALVRLHEGEEPKSIANDLDISYGTVIRYNKELREAHASNKVNALFAAEQGVLENMAEQAIADLPVDLQQAAMIEAETVINGVAGLDRLEGDLQRTATVINTRIRIMTGTAESVGDVVELADALCKLQNAFFGKGTQILVQQNNNNGGSETYGEFLSDVPTQ